MSLHSFSVFLLVLGGFLIFAADDTIQFHPIKYKNCKSVFEILSVEVAGCGNGNHCTFYHNSEPRIRIGFKPDRAISDLRTAVWANLGDASGALVKFHLENDHACEANNITCPLEPGHVYYYVQSVRILNEYPTMDVQVNWLLTNPEAAASSTDGVPESRDICIKFLGTVKKE